MLKLGFTGSSTPVSSAQRMKLVGLFAQLHPFVLHHGDCIEADHLAHMLARRLGMSIVLHPPTIGSKRAYCDYDERRGEQPYLCRNHNIVLETEKLVAVPSSAFEQVRSGTWSTVRYARKLKRPIYIITPFGELETENVS